MCPRIAQIFRIKLFLNITTLFYRSQLHVPLFVRNTWWGSRYCGLGILTPTPDFCFWNYKKFSYVSKKYSDIFEPNCFLTRLLYFNRSQLHVPLYVRNTGWGSRYHGLGILTPTPDFCFWNYKKFSYVSKKCSDLFESNCFLTRLLYFIGHSYMLHCMSEIEGWGQDTMAWVSWPSPQTFVFEIIRKSVMYPRNAQIFLNQIVS